MVNQWHYLYTFIWCIYILLIKNDMFKVSFRYVQHSKNNKWHGTSCPSGHFVRHKGKGTIFSKKGKVRQKKDKDDQKYTKMSGISLFGFEKALSCVQLSALFDTRTTWVIKMKLKTGQKWLTEPNFLRKKLKPHPSVAFAFEQMTHLETCKDFGDQFFWILKQLLETEVD